MYCTVYITVGCVTCTILCSMQMRFSKVRRLAQLARSRSQPCSALKRSPISFLLHMQEPIWAIHVMTFPSVPSRAVS